MQANEIIKRFDALQASRKVVQEIWQEIERYVVPYRGKFFTLENQESSVQWNKYRHYDSTAIEACESLAASMQGSLTSPLIKWFDIAFRDSKLKKHKEAQTWLEECGQITYDALQESNFNTEIAEGYLDLSSFGNTCIIEEQMSADLEEFAGVGFHAVPIKECFFEVDKDGQVLSFYRLLNWTAGQMIDKWGDKGVPEKIREAHKKPSSVDNKYEIIFNVYPRKENKDADTSKILADKARPYGFKYILKDGQNELGDEGGYYEQPAFFARWRKVSGSIWGHSPAHVCLGDIKVLNQLVELILTAAEKAVDPANKTTERGLISDLNQGPRGLIVVRNMDDLQPYESAARFDVGENREIKLQAAIRRAFRVDQLELKETPAMTATEASIRYEMMQRLLGPTLGRLKTDLFDPIIQRTFNVLYRAGKFPETPQAVLDAGSPMDIEYLGPLPRAQKMEQVETIRSTIMSLGAMTEVVPDILDNIDTDDFAQDTARLAGVPASMIRDEAAIKKIRDDREKRMLEREQLENAKIAAEAEAKRGGNAAQPAGAPAQQSSPGA